ncbi:MAG: proteasome assembly chaperone family protein [Acidobacteriota bacterium]
MLDMSVEVRELKPVDLRGGIVIDGFPSTGLANAIASECIIETLKLDLVAVLDSDKFPSLSTIYHSMPNFPARIHANQDLKLAIFISELALEGSLLRAIGKTMLAWAREHECSLILSAGGLPVQALEKTESADLLAVGSTPASLEKIRGAGIKTLEHGAISGIPGVLLNEGRLAGLDVIVFLVRVLKDAPDFRAAAAVTEALGKFAPSCRCDVSSLLVEAEKVEKRLKDIQRESRHLREGMYV